MDNNIVNTMFWQGEGYYYLSYYQVGERWSYTWKFANEQEKADTLVYWTRMDLEKIGV